MRAEALALLACIACAGCSSLGIGAPPVEYDDEGTLKGAFKEVDAKLPAYPRPENLVLLKGVPSTTHQYFIDAASVSVAQDGVVRYASVTKTSGGATNVAFEGMRCETRELRLYATGHADGKWAEAKNTKWQRIVEREKPHQFALYYEYFCPSRILPTPPRRAIEAIRRGVTLNERNVTD